MHQVVHLPRIITWCTVNKMWNKQCFSSFNFISPCRRTRNATVSFVTSVLPSVLIGKFSSHQREFCGVLHCIFFYKNFSTYYDSFKIGPANIYFYNREKLCSLWTMAENISASTIVHGRYLTPSTKVYDTQIQNLPAKDTSMIHCQSVAKL